VRKLSTALLNQAAATSNPIKSEENIKDGEWPKIKFVCSFYFAKARNDLVSHVCGLGGLR